MKASKLTILSILFVSVVFIGAIPMTLKYKLDHNMYTQLTPDESYVYDRYSFGVHNTVVISDLDNCTIIPSDSFQIEIERLGKDVVNFVEKGDTLWVDSIDKENRASQKVRIFMPGAGKVVCRDSNVLLRGSIGMVGIPSFVFDLENSKLSTGPIAEEWRVFQFLGQLEINGLDSAYVNLSGSIRINGLILSDISSVVSGNHVGIDNMQVSYKGKNTVKSKSVAGKLEIQAF
ncbi:MAG: hypothetical protein C0490_09585 [Marivirga sp.]|nr:hypothetical protein [Marivirga sp.]